MFLVKHLVTETIKVKNIPRDVIPRVVIGVGKGEGRICWGLSHTNSPKVTKLLIKSDPKLLDNNQVI